MRGSDAGTKVLLLGSHRRRPNRPRRIKQKDRPKAVSALAVQHVPDDRERRAPAHDRAAAAATLIYNASTPPF